MNINTLSAASAEYKSGSLPVALYENAMRREADGRSSYFARPISRSRLSMLDIANDMVVAGVNGGLSAEQIVSLWSTINAAVLDRVANSFTVDGGLGTYSAKVCGVFESEDDTFSSRRHSIDMAFRPGRTVRQHLSELDVVIRQGNSVKPRISEVHDLESGGADCLTAGGYLEITGSNIAVSGDDPAVGLYFVNTDDETKTVMLEQDKLGMNTPSRLACVVPSGLAEGAYQLKVVTQFARSGTFRKEPLSFVFGRTFDVAAGKA